MAERRAALKPSTQPEGEIVFFPMHRKEVLADFSGILHRSRLARSSFRG